MKRQLTLAIGAALLGMSGAAFAITDTEPNSVTPFNFSTPGARSMGMGGAFLGLADDATAAYTNPAGLTQLVTPEISAEVRRTEYSLPYVNGGSASVSPFNGSGLNIGSADSSLNNLSFMSVVFPHDRLSFAFYRDELVHFNTGYTSSNTGAMVGNFTTFPERESSNVKIINYGFAAAWKASDAISLGAGLSYYNFDINTRITRYGFAPAFTPTNVPLNGQFQRGSDNDVGVTLGARFVFSEHWSAGLNYRRGPSFSYEATSATLANIDFTVFPITVTPTAANIVTDLKNVRFKVPDEFGAGLSWHPTDALVVNFDADYIQYSQLTRGIQSIFGTDSATVSQLSISNGTEIHLGGEYTFTQMSHPFSLRAGIWHDPRHSVEFKGEPGVDVNAVALATLFHGGQGSQNHKAIGLGWAFTKFQLDAAADFSDVTDTFSLSGVYHF